MAGGLCRACLRRSNTIARTANHSSEVAQPHPTAYQRGPASSRGPESDVPPSTAGIPASVVPPSTIGGPASEHVAGHSTCVPEQVAKPQAMDEQLVLAAASASGGQPSAAPSQTSVTSQGPALMRHVVPAARFASGGHDARAPVQVSAASQALAAARHVTAAESKVQRPSLVAPVARLQAWQSLPTLEPHDVSQHTPSAQNPELHSPGSEQGSPLSPWRLKCQVSELPEPPNITAVAPNLAKT
jgi:hypothetical protein